MLKKLPIFITLITLLAITKTAFPARIDEHLAFNVAISKLAESGKTHAITNESPDKIYSENDKLLLGYTFDLSPTGYIVVSADADLPPVIAYSFTNNFTDSNLEQNPLLQLLKTDLTSRIKNISNLPETMLEKHHQKWDALLGVTRSERDFHQWPAEGTTATEGWVETNWTQNAPYNNFCPLDTENGGRSLAGCPSIAIGQIIDYLKTTNGTQFGDDDDYYHNYAGRSYWVDNDYELLDFPSFPQVNEYLDILSYHFENNLPISNDEKAALVFACGVAARQVYTSGGSGTFGVNQAYEAYQKFGFDQCDLLTDSDSNLYQRMAMNVLDSLAVHFASVNAQWTSGHNFVVDGYNTDDYFHVNFGWGGSYNGWYLLPQEIPFGLNVLEGVIVDISAEPINIDNNDSPESAILLQPPVEKDLYKINPAGDVDWFKFYAEEGATLDMHSETFGNFELNSKFWLYGPHDEDGSDVEPTQYIISDDDGYLDFQPWIIWTIEESGYYFLRVAQSGNEPEDPALRNETIGAYWLNLQTTPSSIPNENIVDIPENPVLYQNHPNPFNPNTTINFSIPEQSKVNLGIYDISGNLIKTLISQTKDAGYHSIAWNGTDNNGQNVASGVYFYRIESSGQNETRSMLMLK